MSTEWRSLSGLLVGAVIAATAGAGAAMPASAETLDQRITRLAPAFTVTRPENTAPAPVVIMLHGCGGPRPFIDDMAQVAADAGAVAVVVDSFRPRRISRMAAYATVCTGARLHGRERAGDLYAAVAWVRQQTWADSRRIAVVGWSHGGWTILDALTLRSGAEMERATGITDLPDEPLVGVQRTLIVYPYASVGSLVGRRAWRVAPMSTAIICGRDYIVGVPREPLERQRRRGAPLDIVFFQDATHAFEDAATRDPRVRYNPAATAREQEMLRAMIAAL